MSFIVFINMHFSVEVFFALCYNSKISLYSINLGCRLKKIDSVQSNDCGTGLHKILKNKNKSKWIFSTVITALI